MKFNHVNILILWCTIGIYLFILLHIALFLKPQLNAYYMESETVRWFKTTSHVEFMFETRKKIFLS